MVTDCLDSDHGGSKFHDFINVPVCKYEESEILLYLQAKKLACCLFMVVGRRKELTKSETKDSLSLQVIALGRVTEFVLVTQGFIPTTCY